MYELFLPCPFLFVLHRTIDFQDAQILKASERLGVDRIDPSEHELDQHPDGTGSVRTMPRTRFATLEKTCHKLDGEYPSRTWRAWETYHTSVRSADCGELQVRLLDILDP